MFLRHFFFFDIRTLRILVHTLVLAPENHTTCVFSLSSFFKFSTLILSISNEWFIFSFWRKKTHKNTHKSDFYFKGSWTNLVFVFLCTVICISCIPECVFDRTVMLRLPLCVYSIRKCRFLFLLAGQKEYFKKKCYIQFKLDQFKSLFYTRRKKTGLSIQMLVKSIVVRWFVTFLLQKNRTFENIG